VLSALGLDRQWLDTILNQKNLNIKDIFILTADNSRQYQIIPKGVNAS
jgi:hypothetical protein